MPGTFLVVGLGTFGMNVARALGEAGASVLAVDRDNGPVNAIREVVTKALRCDATDSDAMQAVGAFDVDTAIVALGNHFDASVLVAHALGKHGVRRIIVQVHDERQAEAIRSLGITEAILSPRDTALRLAQRLTHLEESGNTPSRIDDGAGHKPSTRFKAAGQHTLPDTCRPYLIPHDRNQDGVPFVHGMF